MAVHLFKLFFLIPTHWIYHKIATYGASLTIFRNLLFRCWSLLSVGVLPVFVVEGKAPDLKQATMKARNAARTNSSKPSKDSTRKATRSRFASVLKEVRSCSSIFLTAMIIQFCFLFDAIVIFLNILSNER